MRTPATNGRCSLTYERCTGRTSRRRRIGGLAANSAQYAPLSAEGHFAEALEVETAISYPYAAPGDAATTSPAHFRVYYTAPEVGNRQGATVFVCVHGAGYSGLSFAKLAQQLVEANRGVNMQPSAAGGGTDDENRGKVGVLAYDARGHGAFSFCIAVHFRRRHFGEVIVLGTDADN